jgi:N-acetyl-gamma-glutamyl-phosphate reductase
MAWELAHVHPTSFVPSRAELSKSQKESIKHSKRISNPGCYPTGFVALVRPLVDAGIVPPDAPLTVNAVSGYSGGGKGLIEIYEGEDHEPWGAYGYSMNHKHLPEMAKYTGLNKKPIFQPAVATFAQGMVVSVPLHYSLLKEGTTGKDVHAALTEWYEGSSFVKVMPLGESGAKEAGLLERGAFLRPDSLADTNNLELFVFSNDEEERMVLCARLDNLGKGASGAAVQNLNLSLGLDESSGL